MARIGPNGEIIPDSPVIVGAGSPDAPVAVGPAPAPAPAAPPAPAQDPAAAAAAAYLAKPSPQTLAAVQAAAAAKNRPAPAPARPRVVVDKATGLVTTDAPIKVGSGAPTGAMVPDPKNPTQLIPASTLAARDDTPVKVKPGGQGSGAGLGSLASQRPVQQQMMRVTMSGGSRTVTPAQYSPGEATAAKTALAERAKNAESIRNMQDRAIAAMGERIGQQIAKTQIEADRGDALAREQKAKLDAINARLTGYSKALQNAKVDPNRLLNSMSTTRRALTTIGAIFGAMAEGLSGGRVKNAALAMLNQAIERDIAAQRSEIAKITAQAGMDRAQASQVMMQWQQGLKQKRDAMRSLAGLQLTAAGLDSKSADVAAKYYDTALKLKLDAVDVSSKSRDRVTRSSTYSSRQVPVKTGSAGKVDPTTLRKVKDDVAKYDAGLDAAARLQRLLAKAGKLPNVGKGIPNALANDISNTVKDLALFHRKAMGDSGPITEKDLPNFDRIGGGRALLKSTMARRLSEYTRNLKKAKLRAIKTAFTAPGDLAAQGRALQQELSSGAKRAKIGRAQ